MSQGPPALRLRERLVLTFLLAALLPLGITALAVNQQIWSMFRFQLEESRSRSAHLTETVLQDWRQETLRAVQGAAASPELNARSIGLGEQYQLGQVLMERGGLHRLSILDGTGRVLSCGHAPARFGFTDPAALELARCEGGPWTVDGKTLIAMVASGPGGLLVVGARRLPRELLDELARLVGSPAELRPTGSTAPEEPQAVAVPVGDGREVVLRISGEPFRRLSRSVLRNVAVAAAVGAVLAVLLGSVLGGRIARRVDRVASAAARVALGEVDLAPIPSAGRDEVGRLVEAFNRMTRALGDARSRIAEAERRAAWREMARKVAHEIKNSLSPIRLSVENLLMEERLAGGTPDPALEESARIVLDEVERLHRMSAAFSEFARFPDPAPQPVDPAALIRGVVRSHWPEEEGLTVRWELPEVSWELMLDPLGFERLLVNLVGNAREAMPDGGELTIRLERTGDGLLLQVEDTGPGFASEILGRAFEPDVSSKEGGRGMGLALVHRITVDHGGRVRAENPAGGGARVTVEIPEIPGGMRVQTDRFSPET